MNLQSNTTIIKNKVSLLNLAEELEDISRIRQINTLLTI
jgi:hypothetical protein